MASTRPATERAPGPAGGRRHHSPGLHGASFTVEFGAGLDGRRRLAAVEAALRPDISADGPRAKGDSVSMRRLRGGRALEVRVRSTSLVSLRAALNSHMRMAALAVEVSVLARDDEED
jgi:tRNA threonylcarbamoyladenosine modification (KEOPS) complex  Pcc1 subunit